MSTRAGRLSALFLACLLCAAPARHAPAAMESAVTLTVKQVFTRTGTAAPPGETFRYILTPEREGNPMPGNGGAAGYAFSVTGNAKADLDPIRFTDAGEYGYEIRNIPAQMSGYAYDPEVYSLVVYIRDGLPPLVIIYTKGGGKASDIEFKHRYDADLGLIPSDPKLMADPPVVKTVSGSPSAASVFSFRLTAGDRSNPMPAGSANGVKTLRITGAGRGEFGTWAYTAAGTYFYTISEVNTGVNGYTYDTAVYTITDTVRAVDGRLELTRVVTNEANRPVASCSFINAYHGVPSGGGTGGSPGKGPKTGDESQATLYTILLCAACAAALGSGGYLLASKRRGKGGAV